MTGVRVAGLGHYAPVRAVANSEIEGQLGLEAGWIERRTGIRSRRWAADGEALSDMAVRAGAMALDDALKAAGLSRADVGLLLLATSTPDHLLPPSAPLVAHRLGLARAGGIDMAGACAGFVYALALADAFVRVQRRAVLVIAANILSRRINMGERASAVLFADAAGAVALVPDERADRGVVAAELASDGAGYPLIQIPAGGSRTPFRPGLPREEVLMAIADGRAVFQKAVGMMAETSLAVLNRAGLSPGDVDHWVPHQANARIIEATRGRIGLKPEQVLSTVTEYANSSAATIPFTFSMLAAARGYRSGDRVLFSAAGAGLTGGSILLRL